MTVKKIAGFEPFGLTVDGKTVEFGFATEDASKITLQCDHELLGQAIIYLQTIAKEALTRRLAVDPLAEDAEGRESESNLVHRIDFVADAAGRSATVLCTRQTGITSDLQLSPEMIEKLLGALPEVH